MKKTIQHKALYITLVLVVCSFYSNAQISAKFKDIFTRKAQIATLNKQIDSIKAVSASKDNVLLDEKEKTHECEVQLGESNKQLEISNRKISALEKDLDKHKRSLDSLHRLNLESHTYTKEQRTEDSIRYQGLLKKLSEQYTFYIDSLNTAQNSKKTKAEPTKIENYYFKDFKSVITGIPDYKNRYTWTFELFQKVNNEYINVDNEALFNDKKQELLDIINKKIQYEFNLAYKTDPKCFSSKTVPLYNFKNLGIEFQDGSMIFYATFNYTNENCKFLYGYTSVEFSADEIQKYLK